MLQIKTIFHAHHWPFAKVQQEVAALATAGYDAVQISPAQRSPAGNEWYLRYQPVDHLEISGLGTQADLTSLTRAARDVGITIVADVVFNHMAVPPETSRDVWAKAEARRVAGDGSAMAALRQKLNQFPHLDQSDFAPWRDMQGADWDNDHRYESWGNGEWPELIASPKVIGLHKRHLEILYGCGVRGFRFDAVKHMRAAHVGQYVDAIRAFSEPCWMYGEVFSADPAMHREYGALFPTSDFGFIKVLKAALGGGSTFTLEPKAAFLDERSIRFGMNHDLACNPPHLVEGFLFADAATTRLANCLSLVMEGGTALVFADDHQQDATVRACVARRRAGSTFVGPVAVTRVPGLWRLEGARDRLELPTA